jgi:TPR repeat protein
MKSPKTRCIKFILMVFLPFCTLLNNSYAQTSDYDRGLIAFDAKNYKQAVEELKPYAEKGNCIAQFAVGFSYMFGEDIKNDTLARHWLELSAEQKQPKAMGPLSASYFMASNEKDAIVRAYLWGVLAAEYDPIQRMTTTTTLVEHYMKSDELKKAKTLIMQYEKRWKDKEDCR